jgi:hypothetical protein
MATKETVRVVVTNHGKSPRGVNTINGVVTVRPGLSTPEVIITVGERDAMAGGPLQLQELGAGEAVVVPDGTKTAAPAIDDNGDGPEAAQLRKQFDASWNQARQKAGATEGESLTNAIDRLVANEASARSFETSLRAALGLKEGEGIIEAIDALTSRVAELEKKAVGGDTTVALEAKHRGGGSWSVVDPAGNEIVEKLDKAGAEKFNAMSDADKAKFVEANKKPA